MCTSSVLEERTVPGLHEFLFSELQEIAELKSETRILDIGCGSGAWLYRLNQCGFRFLYGIDKSETSIDTRIASIIRADLEYEKEIFEGMKFGLISAIEVIEHLENYGQLLSLVSDRLEDNGYFLLTTPNVHSISARLKFFLTGNLKYFDVNSTPTHITPILIPSLIKVLRNHDLEIREHFAYPPDGSSLLTRGIVKMAEFVLKYFVNNRYPGDINCLLIMKSRKEIN